MRNPSPPPFKEHPRTTRDEGEGRTKRLFDEVVRWGVIFRTHRPDHAEARSIVPRQISFDSMSESGLTDEQLIPELRSIIAKSTNLTSRDFLGFPDVTMCPAAVGAALLIPLLNQNMANPETCPPEATFVEMEVIHWLREALGYPVLGAYNKAMDVGGVFTPGGCLSNFVALLAAREKCFPGSCSNGIPVLPSKIRDPTCLRIDDICGLSQIPKEKDIWFHVDACRGSQLAFSERHRHKLRGIEKADSFTVDLQQAMLIPYDCSLVLFREHSTQASLSIDSDSISNARWSFGETGPFAGSRAFDSLKLWSSIKSHGKNSMGWMIDGRLELTDAIELEVEHRPSLVLLGGTDINSCIFIYVPASVQRYCIEHNIRLSDSDLEKVNQLNLHIQDIIHRERVYYIYGFPLQNCPHGRFIEPERAERKLTQKLYDLFDDKDFVAVVYGSSALQNNAILSNIDLIIFAHSAESSKIQQVVSVFRSVMEGEGILIDFEIPLHRRLLVTFEFAGQAAESGPPLDEAGHVSSISSTPEYLSSDEMLR
ncbi:hypothetical protein FPRO05_05324 [Fusarium proliferatum]|uniref:Uncharacterized protein n=1 Tax=Gibberella intermedia TaxID=948311 RepID=A0A365MQJ5_GIBIN|nr:hypothetical protein FPRO05_05324 [Fusarium proliferatum]